MGDSQERRGWTGAAVFEHERCKPMTILILGAGLQGRACAFDLLEQTDANVILTDAAPVELPDFLTVHQGKRLTIRQLDANDENALREAIMGADAVMNALPYYFNFTVTKLAVEVGTHYADLGGNTEIVQEQKTLHDEAVAKGLSIMPDCGLAPGMANILAAEGVHRFEHARSAKLYVGGLPQEPKPPLNYQVVYSLEGALDYYTTLSWIIRAGAPKQIEALTELECVDFPPPLGSLEAFHTAGGLSTMPWTFADKVDVMEYKTMRYPGHVHIMKAIRDLGLLDLDPVELNGVEVRPRDVFIARVDRDLRIPDAPDVVALKVIVEGQRSDGPGRVTFRLLDGYDVEHGMSAMNRTTGFSLAITGYMQANGEIANVGVRCAYEAMPYRPYADALRQRGVDIVEFEESLLA